VRRVRSDTELLDRINAAQAETILLAGDTAGGGHRWSIVGSDSWQRVCVHLAPDANVPFTPDGG
jgi:hypothetical protein